MNPATPTPNPNTAQEGFSIVEVMTAMFILTVGLISMLALFTTAIDNMQSSQEDLICKQKAREALEAIFTARESSQITFDAINNTSSSGGIFVVGFTGLTTPGADGLLGTADDGTSVETMKLPGPDGQLGTADDQTIVLSNYSRQISITSLMSNNNLVNPDLRQLSVTVQYTNEKGRVRSYTVNTLISRYR
jgi:Tfp pilus assembly protein PilV